MNKFISAIPGRLRTPQTILWLALLLAACCVWLFISKTGPFLVSRDQFNFLRIIEADYAGNLTWQEFFTSHSEHLKPAYLFFFYLNAKYLELNIKIEMFAGLIAQSLTALVLVAQYRQSMKPQRSELFIAVTAIILIAQIFSFNQLASYSFSQLLFGGYAQLLLFFLVFRAADDLWLRRQDNTQLVTVIVLMFVATYTFAGARMPIIVLSVLCVPILLFILGEGEQQRLKIHAALIAVAGVVALLGYKLLLIAPNRRESGEMLHRLIDNPLDVWMFISSSITASALPAMYLKSRGWEMQHFSMAGTAILALMVLVVFIYLRQQLWRKSLMPLMMVLYGWGFAAAVAVGRYGNGFPVETALSPRYVFDTQVAVLGTLWMLLLWISQGEAMNKAKARALAAVGLLVIGFQLAIANHEWKHATSQRRAWTNVEALMRAEASQPATEQEWPRWYCPNVKACKNGAHFLSEHQLNLFRVTAAAPAPSQN